MFSKDFSVAVIGGGMCGLVCAFALSKAGIQVDVFEAAPEFGEAGAGVGIGPNAIQALRKMGVLEAVLARSEHTSPVLRPFLFLSGYGNHQPIYDYPVTDDDRGLPIHRAAFLEAILGLVDPNITHVNKRCISIEHSLSPAEASTLRFSDGTTHRAHLIIGTDGIKSIVRNYVTNDPSNHLTFSKSYAYRGLIPNSSLLAAGIKIDLTRQPLCFVGMERHIITFPIQAGRLINVVAFATDSSLSTVGQQPHPWVHSTSQAELLEHFQGWGKDATSILRCLEEPSRWSIHTVDPPLTSYVKQNIVLVGDSAHGMLPHLGAGVGQGFEDVLVLCELLAHPQTNLSHLSHVLRAYDRVRRPRANMVLEASAKAGLIYESHTEHSLIEDTRGNLAGIWHPVWHHDVMADVRFVVNDLTEQGIYQV